MSMLEMRGGEGERIGGEEREERGSGRGGSREEGGYAITTL